MILLFDVVVRYEQKVEMQQQQQKLQKKQQRITFQQQQQHQQQYAFIAKSSPSLLDMRDDNDDDDDDDADADADDDDEANAAAFEAAKLAAKEIQSRGRRSHVQDALIHRS